MLTPDIALSLQRATGLELTPATVERAIRQRMKQCAITKLDVYLARLHDGDGEFSALTELVVVPETWFFRDHEAFNVVVQFTRDRLAERQRPVSILSLPCATGEEPYSLAMALLDAGVAASDFRIDAMDISSRAIAHATRGVFGRNAFRTKDLAFRDRHFARIDHGYVLSRQIRDNVTFSQGNLMALEPSARAGRYDIVFCRNLLIYFDEATQKEAVSRLSAMLRDDGMLFAGYAEVPVFHQAGFESIRHPMAFGLRKAGAVTPPKAAAPIPAAKIARPVPSLPAKPAVLSVAKPLPPPLPPLAKAPVQDAKILLELARACADRGDFNEAGSRLAECLRHMPDSTEANLLFGLVSERKGDLNTAENYLRRAVYLDPQHYEALCHLALLTEKLGNAAAANATRERAARVFERRESKRAGKGY